jgi:hypothetical protein
MQIKCRLTLHVSAQNGHHQVQKKTIKLTIICNLRSDVLTAVKMSVCGLLFCDAV